MMDAFMSKSVTHSRFNTSSVLINQTDNRKKQLCKPIFVLMIAALSFLIVGCSALNALEPTAVLISDIKGSI
ncbi:hypothetical protein [Psychrobacter sp. T6-3]|uniref:hypothetical protein n=1 Tax=Psychrobacter sp. T6-3 TaxID=3457449 RepID=UPI003FD627B0